MGEVQGADECLLKAVHILIPGISEDGTLQR